MSKPMFSLSVNRYFVFRSSCPDTGEILECETFRDVYKHTRTHLRCEVGDVDDYFRQVSAHIDFGYVTTYEIRRGYYYEEFTPIVSYGTMIISQYSESYTSDDGKQSMVFERGVNK